MLALIFVESQVTSPLSLELASRVGGGAHDLGRLIAINFAVVVLCTPLALHLLAERSAPAVLLTGALFTGVGPAIGGVLGTLGAWVIGMVFHSIGEVTWSTEFNNLLGNLPSPQDAGVYFSVIGFRRVAGVFPGAR